MKPSGIKKKTPTEYIQIFMEEKYFFIRVCLANEKAIFFNSTSAAESAGKISRKELWDIGSHNTAILKSQKLREHKNRCYSTHVRGNNHKAPDFIAHSW